MFAFNGVILVGDIVSFIQYVKRFTQPITQLAQVSNMIQAMAAAAERVFEFLDEPEEAHTEEAFDASVITGEVVFDHVKFGYVPGQTVINDFSARIQKGMTVAIVGPTGAGKTTIVKVDRCTIFGGSFKKSRCLPFGIKKACWRALPSPQTIPLIQNVFHPKFLKRFCMLLL